MSYESGDLKIIHSILLDSNNTIFSLTFRYPMKFILLFFATFISIIASSQNILVNGGYAFNLQLSLKRATTVRNYLKARSGFDGIIARGWSYLKPVADNKTPVGRQKNRRVEFFLYI